MKNKKGVLICIVLAQFCCTSIWFASNAVIINLISEFNLDSNSLGHFTSAVQLGFIIGTLIYALLAVADRYSPSKVFFFSALAGAIFNLACIAESNTFLSLLGFRFFTGFFLAGIYPVGMKIAADYFDRSLGKSLGFLVGALVLGTAFPHLLNGLNLNYSWQYVIIISSSLAFFGGLFLFLFIPDGPFRKPSRGLKLLNFFRSFENVELRIATLGYFGHMWELYAFWTFVPVLISIYSELHQGVEMNISLISFFIIGIGSLGCVLGAYFSQKHGLVKTARFALLCSCLCSLFTPLILLFTSKWIFIGVLLFWGMLVIADSPLFSTLLAQNAKPEMKGSTLTIVNCIGFAISILSIQLINFLYHALNSNLIFSLLAIGPILALVSFWYKKFQ